MTGRPIQGSPPLEISGWKTGDPCDACGEPEGEGDDAFGEFVQPLPSGRERAVVVHGTCGVERGWGRA